MSLQSMTGFARIDGADDIAHWTWEARSVNGKGLDIRIRYPNGFDNLDTDFRKLVKSYFTRGNLQLNLVVEREGGQLAPIINDAVLDAVLSALEKISLKTNLPVTSPEQILAIKGVMEFGETDTTELQNTAMQKAILADLGRLMDELKSSRLQEGDAINGFLIKQLEHIENLTDKVQEDASRSAKNIKARLSEQVAKLFEDQSALDHDRIYQEAAILAAKADVQEELDRLSAHLVAARKLLSTGGPIGRKLDFLCQEFNRECNTICSKSNAASVTVNGLEMKIIIDQFREQVQNLE